MSTGRAPFTDDQIWRARERQLIRLIRGLLSERTDQIDTARNPGRSKPKDRSAATETAIANPSTPQLIECR